MKIPRRGLAYPAVLVAIFLLVHANLVTLPLYDDEVWTIAHADAILENPLRPAVRMWGESSTLSDWGKRPLWEYAYAALVYVFGQSLFLLRISKMAVGLAVLLLLYGIAKKFYDRNVAFLAALLIVLNPFFIRESWFNGGYDLQMSMFYLAGLLLAMNRRYALAGVAIGLAILTKETAVLFVPPLLFFVFLADKKDIFKFLRSREFLQLICVPVLLVSAYYLFDYLRYGFLFGVNESNKVQLPVLGPVLVNSASILGSLTMHLSLFLVSLLFLAVFRQKRAVLGFGLLLSAALLAFYAPLSGSLAGLQSFLPLTPDMLLAAALFLASVLFLAATRRSAVELFLVLGILFPLLPFAFTKHQFPRYYLPIFYLSSILISGEVLRLFYGIGLRWKYLLASLLLFSFAYELAHANAYNLFYLEEHRMAGAVSGYLAEAGPDVLAVDGVRYIDGLYDKPVRLTGEAAASSTKGEFYLVKTGYHADPAGCKKVFEYGYAANAWLLNDPLSAISKGSLLGGLGLKQRSTVHFCANA